DEAVGLVLTSTAWALAGVAGASSRATSATSRPAAPPSRATQRRSAAPARPVRRRTAAVMTVMLPDRAAIGERRVPGRTPARDAPPVSGRTSRAIVDRGPEKVPERGRNHGKGPRTL